MGVGVVVFLLPCLLLLVLQVVPSTMSQNNSLNCPTMCGDIEIPYPFGIGRDCAREESLIVSCNITVGNTSKPFLRDMEISKVQPVVQGEVLVFLDAYRTCYNKSTNKFDTIGTPTFLLGTTKGTTLTFSLRNKFVVTGCATTGYITDHGNQYFTGACTSVCHFLDYVSNTCSRGIGCCENSIMDELQYFNVSFHAEYRLRYADFDNRCNYAFLVEDGMFHFDKSILTADQNFTMKLPVVIDWAIENTEDQDQRCETAMKNLTSYACVSQNSICINAPNDLGYLCNCSKGYSGNPYIKDGCQAGHWGEWMSHYREQKNLTSYACVSQNSICINAPNDLGYLCNCSEGYSGNPYIKDGCQDIDECKNEKMCNGTCLNTIGSFVCFCPEGTSRNAVSSECIPTSSQRLKLLTGLVAGLGGGILFLLFSGVSALIYKVSKKRRKKQLRQKYFKQNHGLLLQQLISSDNDATERTKIFTLKELEKATNNFDSTRVIGDGGHGTVYKGLLLDQRVVAIKKSKLMEQLEIEQFINEVALLSRIDHRNVVKIFGCCLESEVPLLVYEFIGNGTLSDHLHIWSRTSYLSWDDRLRIATEVAGAIAYLHFASSKSIFHRDLKSSNILLDEKLTAKVADFGASKSVTSDQTHVTTAVQGTFGYLDPEYFQTGKLTDKSDVYSMGVILVELLTGQKPVSRARAQEERNLIVHFIWLLQENQICQIFEDPITKEASKEELEVVAKLAGSCLRMKGEERPSMKEVETTLEGLKRSKRKQKRQINHEETESLLSYETPAIGGSRSTTMQPNSQGPLLPSQTFLR